MIELEDRKWFPQWLRQHQMEFLSFLAIRFKIYSPIKPELEKLLNPTKEWTDVCSGSGGPVISLATGSIENQAVRLTDLFPPSQWIAVKNIHYHPADLDFSKELPPGHGLITCFNAWHHFSKQQQKQILENIRESGRPFLAVEILQPTITCFLEIFFTTTLGHWLVVPFMKNLSMRTIIFTYLIPLHTISILYDGIVSVFKSKTARYYQNLVRSVSGNGYRFDFISTGSFYGELYIIKGLKDDKTA